jgi:hypothetical protein
VTRAPLWFVATVAAAVLALVAGVGVTWTAQRSISDRDDRDDLRVDLVATAEEFFLETTHYDLSTEANVEAYKERLAPLLTDAERERFNQQLDKAIQVLGLGEMRSRSTGTLRRSAIEVQDDDSATVMVTGDVEFESTRMQRTSFPRWEVELRLVDGAWLVDGRTELGDGSIISTTESGGG